MIQKEHQRRIYVPPGHRLRPTGSESLQREGVETHLSYFEVIDPAGLRVGSYVIREAKSTQPPFTASVTVETVE